MAIDSTKLLNRPSGSNTVSSKSVKNIATIATTVSSIATIMKGNLVLDKMRDKKRRQKAQQAQYKEQVEAIDARTKYLETKKREVQKLITHTKETANA